MAKMLYAFEVSLQNADWLKTNGPDRASIELARHYCQLIDEAVEVADPTILQKTFAVCGPNLQKTLTSLGLNPEARNELQQEEAQAVNPFDELKKKRQERRTATG
ncbi:hypothetical protein ACIP5Z_01650 [Rothia terrae]|uniref:terminase small subunit n=1 Tax=Rothia terrae TaxID=396015 RepID=UPI00380C9310